MCGLRLAEALGGEPEVVHGAHLALAHKGLPDVEGVPAELARQEQEQIKKIRTVV